ncbi:MAG: ABC transporter permease, partial [Ruminiclostridium sp.]|nr:ABC transporter permease [Ruminiclostridium sp.]
MTILKHEIRQGRSSLIIWTAIIAFMLGVCILIYPEMSKQMDGINEVVANLGGFSAAFGMDKINFGEFIGFFGVECGNVLGLGGAFFAALTGISALSKEERECTAEFLLTHPVSRQSIVVQKFISVIVQIGILNAVAVGITAVATIMIGESPEI